MGKGDWRRPTGPQFDENYCRVFPKARGCVASIAEQKLADEKSDRQARADAHATRMAERATQTIHLSLDQLRAIVFETSVAYGRKGTTTQEKEWNRATALKIALERLGYDKEAEMIGGAA